MPLPRIDACRPVNRADKVPLGVGEKELLHRLLRAFLQQAREPAILVAHGESALLLDAVRRFEASQREGQAVHDAGVPGVVTDEDRMPRRHGIQSGDVGIPSPECMVVEPCGNHPGAFRLAGDPGAQSGVNVIQVVFGAQVDLSE